MAEEVTKVTKAEVEKQLRKAFPNASDAEIKNALPRVTSQEDINYVIKKKGLLPESFWSQVFSGADYLSPSFGDQINSGVNEAITFLIPSGKITKVGEGGKALLKLGKAVFAKKAAEEGVKTAAKMSLKKKALIGAGVLGTGQLAANAMSGKGKDTAATDAAIAAQSEQAVAQAILNADAAGVDVNTILQSTNAQQLNLNSGNLQAFMAKFGLGTTGLTGIGNVGIFTGNETRGTKVGPKGVVYPTSKKELVSLAEWNKQFPSDLNGIASAKQKFVDAGVLDPSAGIDQVKAAWTKYGQLSLDYSRAGNIVSPWDLLKVQKGLSGSGSQTSVTYDTSPMAENDVRTLLKRQMQQSLGLANIDDKMFDDFLKKVRQKEAKNPTKTVTTTTGKTTRRQTTPGYGQSDVLADAEAFAKQDPRYAEFQTANVFGNALVQALGLKA